MVTSYGYTSLSISVGVFLLVLLVACGIGCVWHCKQHHTSQFISLKFLQRKSNKRKNYQKTVCLNSHLIGSNPKTSVETKDHRSTDKESRMHDLYENVAVDPPKAKEAGDQELYENTHPSDFEEHIYGNEGSAEYCNFRKPASSEIPQDEDLYILPDL